MVNSVKIFCSAQKFLQVCEGISGTALECSAPRVPSILVNRSVGRDSQKSLNYTIIMDNAPRPNTTNPELALVTKSDPVFVEIEETDQVYMRGSQEFISILVSCAF